MTNLLLVVLLAVCLVDLALTAAVYTRQHRNDGAQKLDDKVQAAMDETASEEVRQSRRIDEGVENILSYSANLGRGNSTGGGL